MLPLPSHVPPYSSGPCNPTVGTVNRTLFVVLMTEASTISKEWDHATKKHAGSDIIKNVALSGFFFYLYNELAFLVGEPPGMCMRAPRLRSAVLRACCPVRVCLAACKRANARSSAGEPKRELLRQQS